MARFIQDTEFKNLYLDVGTGIFHLRKYLSTRGHLRISLKETNRKKAIQKMREELSRWLQKKKTGVTIDEISEEILKIYDHTKAKATFESFEISRRVHVLPFFTGWPIERVAKAIPSYIAFQKRKNPARKLYHDIKCLSRIFHYAHEQGHIEMVPRIRLDRRERTAAPGKEYSNEEIEKILRALDQTHRFQAALMLATGMRPGEVRTLKWEYIDFDRETISLPPEVVKTRTGREYPMGDWVLEKLFERKKKTKGSYVFPSRFDANTAETRSPKPWQRAEKKVGFKVRPHWFRHTHATRALRGGLQSAFISRNLGMSEEILKRVYHHPSEEDRMRINAIVTKTLPNLQI